MARPEFEDLVERYDKRLFNVMYGLTGDYHDALDLTEEAFIRAMKAYPRFRGDSDPFTWLYRIALNVLKKRYRKNARRSELWRQHQERDPSPTAETRTAEHSLLEEERADLVGPVVQEKAATAPDARVAHQRPSGFEDVEEPLLREPLPHLPERELESAYARWETLEARRA